MQVKAYCLPVLCGLVGVGLWLFLPWDEVLRWAAMQQRELQNSMARSLRAVGSNEPAALVGLCAATAAYGVVHAIGPGHGKVLIGGAALATRATFRWLVGLTLLSSLAQAGTAIALVGLLVFGLRIGARDAADLTEAWLAPLSAAAIGGIGAVLMLRGLRALKQVQMSAPRDGSHDHDHAACGCGHAHGPSVEAVRSLGAAREALAIVASIAIRPCTGALFVLVIAARFDAFAAGVLAVLTMALGTAATTLAVAAGGRLARVAAVFGQDAGSDHGLRLAAVLHLLGGGLILGLSLLFLGPRLS